MALALLYLVVASQVPAPFVHGGTRIEPAKEANLVVVDTAAYRLEYYRSGALVRSHDVSLGQAEGRKRRKGDLKTPRGVYFVIEKYRGAFDGAYGEYYGGHWIKVNYPGPEDAAYGLEKGWIDRATHDAIRTAWASRRATSQKTRLGGGIGFHGWAAEWEGEDGRLRSWGCVVLHNRDVGAFFEDVPVGAMVIIR